jgi:hypothetical protein
MEKKRSLKALQWLLHIQPIFILGRIVIKVFLLIFNGFLFLGIPEDEEEDD